MRLCIRRVRTKLGDPEWFGSLASSIKGKSLHGKPTTQTGRYIVSWPTLSLLAECLGSTQRFFGNVLTIVASLRQCHGLLAELFVGKINQLLGLLDTQGINDVAPVCNVLGTFSRACKSAKSLTMSLRRKLPELMR